MWTQGGASVLDWPELGRLAPGAYADLVVLDRDPLTCALDDLPDVVVHATMTAGAVVTGALASSGAPTGRILVLQTRQL